MKTALITLCDEGARVAETIAVGLNDCDVYVHRQVSILPEATRFDRVVDLTERLFAEYEGLVYILPCGVAVRAIGPNMADKRTDPAVVAVDVGGRWAVSLLSGHEGGANDLALRVANLLDAEPVVSTTTEALKTLIVGVGCQRGTESDRIVRAVETALAKIGAKADDIRLLASADVKQDEPGLLAAARQLGLPVRFISSDQIRNSTREFARSSFVQEKVNLPAVAEPAALLAGRRTQLLLPKQIIESVTVAVARENCAWSE